MAIQIVNEAVQLGVAVEPADVGLKQTYWRVIEILDLESDDKGDAPHLLLEVQDEYGNPISGARLSVRWQGGEEELTTGEMDEQAPGANFSMWKGQVCAVRALGCPSDGVVNLRTDQPDDPLGPLGSLHSFRVAWQRTVKKVFSHYVLFGAPDDPQTQANLVISLGFILRFKPAFGFKAEEAELAERVTIIGGQGSVPLDVQDRLEEAGCWVHRIEGDSRSVDRVLTELQKSGLSFPE